MARNNRPQKDPAVLWLERGVALQQNGDNDAALACYGKIPNSHSAYTDALHLSGIIFARSDNPAKGEALIRKAIERSPRVPLYYVNLANAQESLGNLAGAEASLRTALSIDARYVPALFNLGNMLNKQERDDEAMSLLDRTIVAEPGHVNACIALGDVLLRKRLPRLAVQIAVKAKQLDPQSTLVSDAYIGAMLADRRYGDALVEVDQRLSRSPSSFSLLQARGHCLKMRAVYSESLASYMAAYSIDPTHLDVISEIAHLHTTMGEPRKSLNFLSEVIQSKGVDALTYSNWVFPNNYFADLPADSMVALHQRWETLVDRKRPTFTYPLRPNKKDRIRVGYVSEDFKQHSVSWFIENVLASHDRSRFEVFAYFVNPEPDAVTEKIRRSVDCFRELFKTPPSEIAEQIHQDGVDITIELSGFTSARTLEAILYRPAPVQISWLGYPNTSGVSTIDYRISDAIADPPGIGDRWNSETVLRLPDCFHCYQPGHQIEFDPTPPVSRNGFVTFGSFNVLPKLSAACYAAWAKILNGVPGSKLLIKNRALHDAVVRRGLLERFSAAGLAPERIIISGDQAGWAEHMARYREVDIALDPFPYNGTTTTCEALWMGVPVITSLGDRHAARVGASLLTAAGHPELIAKDVAGYVEIATELGKSPSQIAALHARIHDDFAASPLCDSPRFVGHLEALYTMVWDRYCASHH